MNANPKIKALVNRWDDLNRSVHIHMVLDGQTKLLVKVCQHKSPYDGLSCPPTISCDAVSGVSVKFANIVSLALAKAVEVAAELESREAWDDHAPLMDGTNWWRRGAHEIRVDGGRTWVNERW